LSCSDCAQCSSVKNSRIPPGDDPGVVYQDIDAAERGVTLLDEILRIGRLGQIGWYRHDFSVRLPRDLCGGSFQLLLAPRADRDIDALARQGKSDRLADTLARSGDECRLAIHLEIHADFSLVSNRDDVTE
jgi:hypothetical protein